MRLFKKRRYRSQSQQVVMAGFLFGSVFVGIIAMIVLSAEMPKYQSHDDVMQQDAIVSEVISRIDGRGAY